MPPSLYQSSWKHNRLIKDTAQLSKMGLGCVGGGWGCHGLGTTPACHRAACMSALGNTECQQPIHRTVYLPWCPGRSCPGSQEGAHANSHPSVVRDGLGCHSYCHLKDGRWGKQILFLPDYLWPYQTKVNIHLPSLAVSVKHSKAQTSHPAQRAISG